ncbi:hypothetical protein [Breoghania sp.]|uniref:hypothetical protein n=1 Tax=Breoghania sp. TaxID=2065378 RepID=UPI00261AE386|nr:hypothetical protein [Breoghania sp.]MDJ0933094.1 hypothetical protein [Breoghania sp.]
MLERFEVDGTYRYDLYPHHIWSNPFLFSEFASLAPDRIDHDVYRTTSECVRLGETEPEMDVRASSEFSIPTALGASPGMTESSPK